MDRTLVYVEKLELRVVTGTGIRAAIETAIGISRQHASPGSVSTEYRAGPLVVFDFNDVIVRVRGDSIPDLIERDWWRAGHRLRGKRIVGPYPPLSLSARTLRRDRQLQDELEDWRVERRLSGLY